MTPDECKSVLHGNLDESLLLAGDLQECLTTERRALEDRDAPALESAAMQKRGLVEKLDTLDRQRNSAGELCGFTASANLIDDLSQWCADPTLVTRWQQFLELARKCSDLNNCIGAVIRVRQLQVQDALGLLRGKSPSSSTYGPTGQEGRNLGSRALAQA